MIRILFILIFLISSFKIAYAQDSIDSKYLHALLYLKTNEDVNKKIKWTFKKSLKLKKKEKFVDFHIQKEIRFMNINQFESELKKKDYGIKEDKELLDDFKLYTEHYDFANYEEDRLGELISSPDSDLVLVFSKPTNNYLIAIMLDSRVTRDGKSLLGRSIMFLFVYDEHGLVKDVAFSMAIIG